MTYADLKPGEWFRWAGDWLDAPEILRIKLDDDTYAYHEGRWRWRLMCDIGDSRREAVIRTTPTGERLGEEGTA